MYPGLHPPWHDPQQFRLLRISRRGRRVAPGGGYGALIRTEFEDELDATLVPSGGGATWSSTRTATEVGPLALCPRTAAVIDANRTVLSTVGCLPVGARPCNLCGAARGADYMRLPVTSASRCPRVVGCVLADSRAHGRKDAAWFSTTASPMRSGTAGTRRRLVLVVTFGIRPHDDEVALLNALQLPAI